MRIRDFGFVVTFLALALAVPLQVGAQTTADVPSPLTYDTPTATSEAEQRALDRANEPNTYGTTDTIVLQIPAAAFTTAGNNFMIEDVTGYYYVTSADSNARRLVAPGQPAGGCPDPVARPVLPRR